MAAPLPEQGLRKHLNVAQAQTGAGPLGRIISSTAAVTKTKCKAGKTNAQQQKVEWIPAEVPGAEIQDSEWGNS